MTDPQSYAWWYGSSNHVSSVSGISASSVGKGDVERYEKNQSIDLSKVTWASGTHYGFLPVSTGADDYVGSGWTWHLDGYIDIAQVQASYKIRYVDQDTNNVLKIAASGTDDPGVWIDHSAPKKLDGGYEIVGDTDRTFKLEQIDNTFDIYYRRPYGYTVEYYYDDVKDEDATVIGERQMCGTKINTYTQKPKDGYELDRVENFPLTIQADESKNVIKVYYKKIGYTVTYEPGEHGTFKTQKHDAKHGDATPAFDGETTGKPGWKFDGWEPKVADTVTGNATYTAVFVPDETKTATVLYTISIGQSDYGSIAPSAQQIILQATGKLDSDVGGSVSGSTATAKPGYKFAGWYKATGEATYEWVTDDPKLTSELAESELNRDEKTGLYQNTVFEARFEPDEKQTATVTYTAENGTVTHASDTILQADASGLTGSTATPNPGYKFDGWYKGDERITTDLTLTPKMAKDKLDKDENGLYANTTFTAKCVLDEDQNATVLCTIDKTQIGYGTVYPSIYQTILQATGKLANGDPISGSMATANAGYKFVGWYKVTGEETYEKVTDDPELTSELAESKLNKDEKTGLYRNTVFVARFEPDAGAKVPVTYEAENGTLEGTTSQEAQIVTGEGLTDVEATPNKGYKFDGWYNGTDFITKELTLTPEMAKPKLNKNGNLYAATTFIARFVPDENQTVPVIYTTDENGILWGGPAIGSITYNVNIATGKVWLNNAFVDELEPVPTYPKDGYEFDRWIRVSPETTIEGAGSTLTDEKARPNLNQEDGLYQKTEFKAIFKPRTDLSYTVNYYWNGTEIPVKPSKTVLHQTFGEEVTESPIGADDYTPESNEPKKIKIGADSTQNVINFYYYRNVNLTANSDAVTYDGNDRSVFGFTGAPKEADFSAIQVSAMGKNFGTYPAAFAEGTVGTVDKTKKYIVTDATNGQLTINKRNVVLTSETASKPYDGTELTRPVVAVTGDGFVDGEVTDIKAKGKVTHVSEGKMTNTITYTPVDGKFDANNYTITKNEGELWITPNTDEVAVTIEGRTKTVTYNGEEHTAWQYDVVSISDPLYETAPGGVPNFWNKNAKKAKGTDAGTYPMGWEAADFENTNTNFSNVKFVVTDGQLVINPRPVVLTSGSDSKVYNGEALTKDEVTASTGENEGFVKDQGATYNVTGSQTDVGTSNNTFTYELNSNTKAGNYEITKTEGTLEVTPVTDRVTVKIKGKTDSVMYDGKPHFVFGFDAEPSNKLYNPLKDMQFNGTDVDMIAEGTDAGTYQMKLTDDRFTNISGNFTNVKFEVVEDGKLEIKKRSVTLTSGSAEKVYDGNALTNDTVTVSGDGFADGEGATYDFTGSQTDVGESKNVFTFEVNANTNKDNYTFEVAIGTLKVNPVTDKVTVTVTEKSDTVTYDGKEHIVSGYESMTADNPLYDEDSVEENPTVMWAAKGTNVGEYPVGIVAGDFKNTNANFTNVEFVVVDGALEITPAPVTLQAPIASKTYDGEPLKAEDYVHSYVEGVNFADDFAAVILTGSQTLVGSSSSLITEVIPKEGKKLKNYKFTFLPGTLTITDGTGDDPVKPENVVTKTHIPKDMGYNLGEPVTFTISVKNIYNTPKTITLTEKANVKFSNGENAIEFKDVPAGETVTAEATYTITSEDILEGVFHNTVTADFTGGGSWTAEDTVTTAELNTTLNVTKTSDVPEGQKAALGQKITYTIKVQNAGNVPYTNVKVEDPLTGLTETIETLPVGETKTFTTEYVVTEADVLKGSVLNTATATGDKIKDPKGDEQKEPNGGDELEIKTFAPITIKPKDVTATYNGAAITGKDVEITSGKLLEGHKLSAAVVGSGVNAGSYELTLDPEKITIVDANNKDVSEMYARTILPGKLIINKRSVLITSQSATKTYDGSALTRPAVTITGDGFVPGELAKAEATGSITKVGSTPNAIRYTTTGAFNAANYSIALSVGTLTVTEKPKPEPRRTFNLTINYVYQNGKRAAASYNRGGLKNGETFDITSPVIAGYTASETVVSGTIYNRDIKVTVIYTADGVNLDDYGVPLGLGNITMNVGDCFE